MHTTENQFETVSVFIKKKDSILKKFNSVKFAAYRTALKLRSIQKLLGMSQISLFTISCVFEKHQIQNKNLFLNNLKIESILSDIYYAVFKKNEVNTISLSMMSFLSAVCERESEGQIPVLPFKIYLILLCSARPREKYCCFFSLLADNNNGLSKNRLKLLLTYIVKVIDFIGESSSFGSTLIEGTVKSCFETNNRIHKVSEDDFVSWLTKDPQFLIWLSILYRIEISEKVSHPSKCKICKINPIVGLKYQCLKCLSLSMCQTCFFSGKIIKKHKLMHPVQEYCYPQTAKQTFKSFFSTVENILCKKNHKIQYLPVIKINSVKLEFSNFDNLHISSDFDSDKFQISSSKKINNDSLMSYDFLKKIQNMILNLESKSNQLILEVENLNLNSETKPLNYYKSQLKNLLLKHTIEVNYQIEQLKVLKKDELMTEKQTPNCSIIASTPVIKKFSLMQKKKIVSKNSESLSPITNCMFLYKSKIEEPLFSDISNFEKEECSQDKNFLAKCEKLSLSTWSEETCLNDSDNNFESERLWLQTISQDKLLLDELDSRLLLVLNKLADLIKNFDL